MRIHYKTACLIAALLGCCSLSLLAQDNAAPKKPNIVLILADDAALMDFGAYGGEAATPNINQLAAQGTMFTNYHASPMCAPSRAMLLTGYDSHLTGVPNLPIFLPEDYRKKPGYAGILNDEVKTLATRLKAIGYNTYMTGKWHLGHTPTTLPSKRGFDRTYILDASGADNWEQRPYLPTQSKPPWFKDGQPIELPDDFYSSRNLVDEMIGFMKEEKERDKPFFAYLSFQAIHIPVQAPKAFVDKYEGVYDGGWDALRLQRFQKAKQLGLIPADAVLGEMLPVLKKWETLTENTRKIAAKSMAVNAAMLEAMDFHIGRYLAYLKAEGELDNTIFIVTSDNGPEASDPSLANGMNAWLKWVGYTRDYETLGEKGSFVYIGPEFGSAAASPNSFFKFYAGEGGLRVPMIVSGANLPTAQKNHALTFITDVVPTILDLVGAPKAPQMTGRSWLPLLAKTDSIVYQPSENIGMEAAGQAALFRGDMKLVRNGLPYGDGVWRLYNLKKDPGEVVDLSKVEVALFEDMKKAYDAYAQQNGVLEMPEGYETIKVIEKDFRKKLALSILPWLIAFFVGIWWLRKRRRS